MAGNNFFEHRGSIEVRDLAGDQLELHFVPPVEHFDMPDGLRQLIGHATMMEEDPSRVASVIVDQASLPRWGEGAMELIEESAHELGRSVVDLTREALQARALESVAKQ